jgi:hypothetical protein
MLWVGVYNEILHDIPYKGEVYRPYDWQILMKDYNEWSYLDMKKQDYNVF